MRAPDFGRTQVVDSSSLSPAPSSKNLGRSSKARIGLLEAWVWLNVAALSLLPLIMAKSARFTDDEKAAQALVFGWIFATALPVVAATAKRYTGRVLAVYGVAAVFCIPAVFQTYFYPVWFLGDILLLIAPVLMGIGIVAATEARPDLPDQVLKVFLSALLAGAVLAFFFPDSGGRYDAPAPLLMAGAWIFLFGKRGSHRYLGIGAIVLVGLLSWNSQVRSAIFVFLIIGFIAFWCVRGAARAVSTFGVATLLAGLIISIVGLSASEIFDANSDNRLLRTFGKVGIQSGVGRVEDDQSLRTRFIEGDAVLATAGEEWSPINYVLGAGHGSTYDMRNLVAVPSNALFLTTNASADGRIHSIHLGPLLVLYRYGLVGLFALVALLGIFAKYIIAAARAHDYYRLTAAIGMAGYIAWFVLTNVMNQVDFAMTVVLLVAFVSPRRLEGMSSRADEFESAPAPSLTRGRDFQSIKRQGHRNAAISHAENSV